MAVNQVINFVNIIGPIIAMEAKKRGYIICSTVIAQAIIESRYGESQLASKYHNYFGIKCGKQWIADGKPSVNLKTKEEYKPGTLTTITDYFRVYPNMQKGVEGYYDFISAKRYANLKTAINYTQYAEFLKADGYATSSTYVKTLTDTVVKYGLTAFDTVPNTKLPTSESTDGSLLYVVGKTYTLQSDLYVRDAANGNKIKFDKLTMNAQENGKKDILGYGILKKGTRVTCKGIKILPNNNEWIKIPSGWICGRNSKNIYVK